VNAKDYKKRTPVCCYVEKCRMLREDMMRVLVGG
jgi:hypothetical protein